MKNLIFFLSLLFTTATYANRESGGIITSTAVYIKSMSVGPGFDQLTIDVAESSIKQFKQEQKIIEVDRSQKDILCVKFIDVPSRLAFIKDITPPIIEDRYYTSVLRTSVRAGINCIDYSSAIEQLISF